MINTEDIFQARASLLDRLIDDMPDRSRELKPLRTQSREEFRDSLCRDLLWLLNTRTPLPGTRFDETDLTVTDYGIPDFGSYSTASSENHSLLVRRMERSISAFEPRLRNVRVHTDPAIRNEKKIAVVIEAMMVMENVREPVSFRTIFQNDTGEWNMTVY